MIESQWTQVFAALLTPIIAVFGIFIAYGQWRIAQKKLKFELFEKRFSVYDAIRSFIASIVTSGRVEDREIGKFISGTREAKWLLNDDIAIYVDEQIWKKSVEHQLLDSLLKDLPIGDELEKRAQDQAEIKIWFISQYKILDEKFSPFLKFYD